MSKAHLTTAAAGSSQGAKGSSGKVPAKAAPQTKAKSQAKAGSSSAAGSGQGSGPKDKKPPLPPPQDPPEEVKSSHAGKEEESEEEEPKAKDIIVDPQHDVAEERADQSAPQKRQGALECPHWWDRVVTKKEVDELDEAEELWNHLRGKASKGAGRSKQRLSPTTSSSALSFCALASLAVAWSTRTLVASLGGGSL